MTDDFKYQCEQFSDIRILRYRIPEWENLPLKRKKLIYFLHQAAHSGRDIIYDQNYKHNLLIRKTLHQIWMQGPTNQQSEAYSAFQVYAKRFWFSNGFHHHYSMDKFFPECSKEDFQELIMQSDPNGFPMQDHESIADFSGRLCDLIFEKDYDQKRVSLDASHDVVQASACNFYEGLTQQEAEDFYRAKVQANPDEPISYGLNSKLIKENGAFVEKVWKSGGMYGEAIDKIIYWLELALDVAENSKQQHAIRLLIDFYKSGDLKLFDEFSIAWLEDTESEVDFINGFIEVYGDPLGRKATFESVVMLRDEEGTKRAKTISDHAQWFENHSTTDACFKKEKVTGVTARGVHVVAESGDCSPATPIGINLPNADWIRAKHGSKSVNLSNIVDAYDAASKDSGALEEFAFSEEEVRLSKSYGTLAGNLHTDLHEIVGHGSGKLAAGVPDPAESLKIYSSTIEEARADLVALYFIMDKKLIELGLMPSLDVGKTEYNSYIRGGLMTQLVRVDIGKDLEESHMRNRQIIAKWAYEKALESDVIKKLTIEGKTYFVIQDYEKLRELFGVLLREVQRIKSEGDYDAAQKLVETYGVKIDQELHKEVKSRWEKLNIPPYSGFINPEFQCFVNENGEVERIDVSYPDDFAAQMLRYDEQFGFLSVL